VLRLPRPVAMELLLTGQPLSAQEACDRGVINLVVPADQVRSAARSLAAQIVRSAPLAVAAVLEVLEATEAGPYRTASPCCAPAGCPGTPPCSARRTPPRGRPPSPSAARRHGRAGEWRGGGAGAALSAWSRAVTGDFEPAMCSRFAPGGPAGDTRNGRARRAAELAGYPPDGTGTRCPSTGSPADGRAGAGRERRVRNGGTGRSATARPAVVSSAGRCLDLSQEQLAGRVRQPLQGLLEVDRGALLHIAGQR
jgi:Enoyl-CoA hydratase/isomerase